MAKYNYVKNIGFTCCGLVTIFTLISLFCPKLLSIGHEVVCGPKDNNEYYMTNKLANDEIKYGMFNIIDMRNHIKNNGKLNEDDEIIQKFSVPLLRIAPLESIPQNYNYFPNVELNGKEIFKFNIKLNSFSKESSDLLD